MAVAEPATPAPSLRERAPVKPLALGTAIVAVWLLLDQRGFAIGAFWLIGVAFGVILQRSRLCFAGAFRDLILLGDGRLFRAILIGLAVAAVGFVLLEARLAPNPGFGIAPAGPHIQPVGIATVVGGVLFGVGMVLAGGCVSGSLWRMGEGYVASWVAMAGIVAGTIVANRQWTWWYDNDIRERTAVWLPAELGGYPAALALTLAGLAALYIAVLWWESRTPKMPEFPAPPPEPAFGWRDQLRQGWEKVWGGHGWSYATGAIALAVVSVFALGLQVPLGVTGGISLWADNVLGWFNASSLPLKGSELLAGCTPGGAEKWFTVRTATMLGLVAGAFTASMLSGEFRIRRPRQWSRYVQAGAGGLLMGYASVIAIGCTIGAFFSSIPSLALAGWVYGIALFGGAWIGVALIRRLP
jgi:uncharacterized membrane protein YedE/YeeE